MRILYLVPLLLLTSCRGFSGIPINLIDDPEVFYCPVGEFAYCEGKAADALNCQCIDRRLQKAVLERLS